MVEVTTDITILSLTLFTMVEATMVDLDNRIMVGLVTVIFGVHLLIMEGQTMLSL